MPNKCGLKEAHESSISLLLWVHDHRKQELGALSLFLMTINTSKELLKSRNVYNFQILFWLDGRVPHSRVSNMAAENDTPQSMMVVVLLPPTPQQRSNTAAPPPSSDTGQHYCGGGTQPSNTLCHCSRATAQCWWVGGRPTTLQLHSVTLYIDQICPMSMSFKLHNENK